MGALAAQPSESLVNFAARLGLESSSPIRWDLLELALTHPSTSGDENYEQLEFLGDSVVRLVAAKGLWTENPNGKVGEWSSIRSVLVSDRILAEIASSFGFEQFLKVGASAKDDHKGKTSRLADAFEAVLGCLFLSTQTLDLIEPWLEPIFTQYANMIRSDPTYQNYKAALQQWTQAHHKVLPEYRVKPIEDNPAQKLDPSFEAEVWLLGQCFGVGQGRSMKQAEKAAAQKAYQALTLSKTNEHSS